MALLDNSGDIILDAVLTERGRRRMATGNFRIVKFALGDDEIDYKLYDKNNASGSAYYDLKILQTPVMQATTQNSSINNGLITYANSNLLYMPQMVINGKVANTLLPQKKIYYLAVNDGSTANALIAGFGGATSGGDRKVLQAGQQNGTHLLLETGLNNSTMAATAANKSTYVVAQGLQESSFDVYVDTRFINNVLGPRSGDHFNNNGGSGTAQIQMRLKNNLPAIRDSILRNHSAARVKSLNNNVFKRTMDKIPDTDTSAIAGPRASVTALNFDVKVLSTADYKRHGKTAQTIAGCAGTYSYIDTTVKIVGSTGITEQIAIRITQKE